MSVDGVENPDGDDGASAAGLSRLAGVGNPDDDVVVGTVIVCRRFASRPVLSVSCGSLVSFLFLAGFAV